MSTTSPTTPRTVHKTYATIGYFATFICLGLSTAALGPTLPTLAENTHSTLNAISYLFIGRSAGYMMGSFLGGRLYDRLPGHRLIASMLAVMAVMIFFIPLVPSLGMLILVMAVLGFGEGSIDVGGNTLITRVHPVDLGPYMNALHFFFGVGTSIAPIIIVQAAIRSGQFAWSYWALALLFIPVILWLFPQPSPAIQMETDHNPDQHNFNRTLVFLVCALLFLYVGAEMGFGSWIFTYAVRLDLASVAQAAYLNSLFWGGFTLGRLLAIPIAAKFTPQSILTVDLIGSMVCIAAILIYPYSQTVLWIATAGTGLFFASIFPTTLVLAERYMALTGKVTGYFLVGSSLGGMTIPWLIGQLFEPYGARVTMVIILATTVICFLVFLRLALFVRPAANLSTDYAD
jgi:MFS transporter, FHS family, Na+ dependent glucose transporter 1